MTNPTAYYDRIARLADAWRGCLVEVDDCVFWIKVAGARGLPMPAKRVKRYLEYVRHVSEYQEQMDALGVEYIAEAA